MRQEPVFMRGFKYLSYLTILSGDNMALLLTIDCVTLLVQASLCVGAQNVFQVYHPVPTNENRSTGCNEDVLLMEHRCFPRAMGSHSLVSTK